MALFLLILFHFLLSFPLPRFQSPSDARKLMHYLDPKLGVVLPERNYAEHCELYTPNDPTSKFRNLLDTVNDEFIWAHLIGWWGKTIVIRDASLCWILSILFELLEMSFEHMLPNFKECWWDHIILDILVCNGLGIYLGLLTCRYLNMKEYDWTGLFRGNKPPPPNPKPSLPVNTDSDPMWKRFLSQFMPQTYDEFHWDISKSWRRFGCMLILLTIFSVVELNAFFLKYLLWIPPPHPINVSRISFFILLYPLFPILQ